MTSPATIARDNAQHCEAKKHALRQTQDGIVVAFVLHPNDVPPSLQLAPLGTRYMLALVEIGEDENPVNRKEAIPSGSDPQKPAPEADNASPVRAPRKLVMPENRLTRTAAILCTDPVFQTFLFEHDMIDGRSEEKAKLAIYFICHVKSRKEIIPGTPAADAWDDLYSKFIAWKIAA